MSLLRYVWQKLQSFGDRGKEATKQTAATIMCCSSFLPMTDYTMHRPPQARESEQRVVAILYTKINDIIINYAG